MEVLRSRRLDLLRLGVESLKELECEGSRPVPEDASGSELTPKWLAQGRVNEA